MTRLVIIAMAKPRKRKWDYKQIGVVVVIVLMVLSMGAGVIGWIAGGGDDGAEQDLNQSGGHVGVVGGRDVYKVTDHDYYAYLQQGGQLVEWHFRANPVLAANVPVNDDAKYYLRILAERPPFYLSWESITKVYITFDPYDPASVIASGTELAYGLGAAGWSELDGTLGIAYTRESEENPETQVITMTDVLDMNRSGILAMNIFIDAGDQTEIEGMGLNRRFDQNVSDETDKLILIHGVNATDLDLAAVKVKMILLGMITLEDI